MADSSNDVFCFFLVSCLFHCSNCENLRLIPEEIVTNEKLYHNQSRTYLLTNLSKGHHYELRISYPATSWLSFSSIRTVLVMQIDNFTTSQQRGSLYVIPAEFLIKLSSTLPIHQGRKLLNIEKLMFENDKHEQYATITAIRVGLPQDPERLNDPVYFNIVLQKLYVGLPLEVWKTGLLILFALFITLTLVLPKVQDVFEQEKLKSTKNM